MKKLLEKIRRIPDKLLSKIGGGFFWRYRHIFYKKWAADYLGEKSVNSPHRKLLIEKISSYAPFETAFEFGCSSGPNLFLLSQKFPNAKFYGTDISDYALKFGQRWFNNKNIKNVKLISGNTNVLKQFNDKSIDIVFTDATLVYIGPLQIKNVLKELLRLARKMVLLIEWHTNSPKSIFVDHWAHNYDELLKDLGYKNKIKFTKIPEEIWAAEWVKYGYIIEIPLA